jgi:hypothetical protein
MTANRYQTHTTPTDKNKLKKRIVNFQFSQQKASKPS